MARTMRSTTTLDEDGSEQEQKPVRRGRPKKPPMLMGNVTDETIAEFGNKALTAKLEAEKKRDEAKSLDGQFRAVLKSAKDAGVDPDAVRWWIKARKQEPEDLDREIMWQNRMAKVMGLPIGTQLGVDFETGETIASTVDKAQMRRTKGKAGAKRKANGKGEADPRAAYALGVETGRAGKSPKTAGKGLTGEAAVQFQRGWQVGQSEASRQLGPEGELAN